MTAESFIERWRSSGAAERANYVLFLSELCDLLEVPRPEPASLPERVRAVRHYLLQTPAPAPPETVARNFMRARSPEVRSILETLVALGHAKSEAGSYWV
jgi:hypothetical protein